MMTKNADKKREQMMMFSMDSMVPQDHMLRLIDKAINWNFIYDLVEDKYCQNNGRPSMDPVMLVKIPFIQYLYGIKSMRQTIREIEVNVAYRWFLGLDMLDPGPYRALIAMGVSPLAAIRHAVLPQIAPAFGSAVLYRFDVNIREASVLGLVGAGGIGAPLIFAMNKYDWSRAGAILLGLILLVWMVDVVSGKLTQT